MTQAQLSEAAGISSSHISSLEIGQHRPSVKTRVRLLEFLEAVVAKRSKPYSGRPEAQPAYEHEAG